MNEILLQILMVLLNAVLLAVTLATPILVPRLVRLLAAKRDVATNEVEQEKRAERQSRIEDACVTAVNSIAQGYVSPLKDAASDGKLTEAERKEAFAKAITAARKHLLTLGIEGVDVSSEILEDYIEEAVGRLKR